MDKVLFDSLGPPVANVSDFIRSISQLHTSPVDSDFILPIDDQNPPPPEFTVYHQITNFCYLKNISQPALVKISRLLFNHIFTLTREMKRKKRLLLQAIEDHKDQILLLISSPGIREYIITLSGNERVKF